MIFNPCSHPACRFCRSRHVDYRHAQTMAEWPSFDMTYMPIMPADWTDESWHNDACPVLSVPLACQDDSTELRVAVDYFHPGLRYDREGADRYAAWYHDFLTDREVQLYLGEDWEECVAAVEAFRKGWDSAHRSK